MLVAILSLLVIAIVLFVYSFFLIDKFNNLEGQIEQFTISTMQDSYQIKKKIKILEEELLTDNWVEDTIPASSISTQTPMLRTIYKLHDQGMSVKEIAEETSLSEYDVYSILNQYSKER
ncbi:helix-turn-helix domain-containing protein [Radiobacillus deserti]|uniref:Resolvase HTH domain-containing protein n=1 Tax=Radiobacillus deserti TaxID=2594883 RepID=A0A516KGT4_9BACI|nr:hypothetical protein [Radiobacillus deserti]QDP40613.1 hypothetical protein FN924_10675 [Radiobacillus deserti]